MLDSRKNFHPKFEDKPADEEEILSVTLTTVPQLFALSSLLHELTVTIKWWTKKKKLALRAEERIQTRNTLPGN